MITDVYFALYITMKKKPEQIMKLYNQHDIREYRKLIQNLE